MEQPEFAVDPEVLRLAMRQWATGVTIVTSLHAGVRHGMTVSSFTSIALVPPLVLVSLERGTRTHQLVQHSGVYGVTILSAEQQPISDRFAGRQTEFSNRFDGLDTYTLTSGVPLLTDGLAGFDCEVVATYELGSHTVFIGEVRSANVGAAGAPLIYYDRGYRRLAD